jgi:hypothetical protein
MNLPFLKRRPNPIDLLANGLFVDTETAGLDPHVNGILSVGCVTADGKHEYYGECHIYTFQKIEKAALKVNGFTEAQCKDSDKDSPHEMVRKWVEWLRSILPPNLTSSDLHPPLGYIIGKNPSFDLRMLQTPWDAVFAKDGPKPEPFPISYRTLDLTTLAAAIYLKAGKVIPAGGIGSSTLQEYVGLREEPKPHNGLTGAKYCREQALRLVAKL